MSVKKGQNNFKKLQEKKIKETTQKIEMAISKLPKNMEKVTLAKIIQFVSDEIGMHYTTIYKNEDYKDMCNQEFLRRSLDKVGKTKNKDIAFLEGKVRLLELENANLKNQNISLNNVVRRLETGDNSSNSANDDYKEKFEALLEHFKDQVEIKDGKVIDPFGGIRPIEICDI
jgi:translation initiation factor 2B subunit (eIF-2B alpha/beta/delta family)